VVLVYIFLIIYVILYQNTAIGASVKPSFYKKFKNIVKEGIIYEISQFTVGNNGESFRSTDHEFKINFQYSTSVFRRNPPQPIPMYGFHFKELSQVTSRDFDMKNLFGMCINLIVWFWLYVIIMYELVVTCRLI